MRRVFSVRLKNKSQYYPNDLIHYWVLAKTAQEATAKALDKAGSVYRITEVKEEGTIDIY
jgi:hypothetical protein